MAIRNSDLDARLSLALDLAREAGELTLRYFRSEGWQVEIKPDATPVTVADREAEQLIRRRVRQAFSGDGVLGEEFGEEQGESGYRWIVDPIDGTKSFIRGVPLYGTLIGIEREGDSVVGVIHLPPMGETVYAAAGGGAWHAIGRGEPRRARVSGCERLADSLFCTSEPSGFLKKGRFDAFERLIAACHVSRTWGDCYGYSLVATGRAEVMVDPQMNVWDAAALLPILQEAGGTYTDWLGNPTIHGGEGIATNGRVLAEVLAMTARPT